MEILSEIIAITKKDFKLSIRFKTAYLLNTFINPFLSVIPLFIIYYGFLHYTGSEGFGGVTADNYVQFLIFGIIAQAFFYNGTYIFALKFREEKYWKTIDALFVAPINYLSLIIGTGINVGLNLLPLFLVFLLFASVFGAPSILMITLTVLIMFILLGFCLGAGLIYGALTLFNENFDPFFRYFFAAWILLSCFAYPLNIIPEVFRGIVLINPVFHAVNFAREMWMHNFIAWGSFFYVLGFAIIMPIISVFVFKLAWKRMEVQGY
ncbi:ABC transporter permease [Candidatus Micrarchaeota archaeon]|nr:ABC transporter permease [Candidatus Micrarchaeota archaeon]MBU2475911.1 ABC transporter permease [Candidatus Micrarchaeota archaeon]